MIAIVDYGAGNLKSVEKVFEFLGEEVKITNSEEEIKNAKGIVLPGVGAFKDAMNKLEGVNLIKILKELIAQDTPFLGICLGLQMLFDYSEEGGERVEGLGVLKGGVKRFKPDSNLKTPHMGWNNLKIEKDTFIFKNIPDMSWFYYVHSYFIEAEDKEIVIGKTNYGIEFDAIIQKGNLIATQFHPEKSGFVGVKMISNFIEKTKQYKV